MRAVWLLCFSCLLFVVCLGDARAQAAGPITKDSCNSTSAGCTKEQAWTAAEAYASYARTVGYPKAKAADRNNGFQIGVFSDEGCTTGGCSAITNKVYALVCPPPTVWQESTHKCFDPSVCLAKPALPYGSFYKGPALTNRACAGGCSFGPEAGGSDIQVEIPGQPSITIMSGWKPTGEACGPNEVPVTDPTPQECVPVPGMTVCIRGDGQHCYSATSGRQICWTPGEVGTKTDGPVVQQRNGGNTPATPPAPPPGDTLNPGPSTTTTTHTTNTTITTTTTNYSTGSGADGSTGGKNDGEAGDGSGAGKDDEGDGKEKFGTVTGDVNNCHAPPTITPGDNPLDAHLLNVEWLQNCQGLDGLNSEIDAAKALVLEQEAVWNSGLQDYEGWAAYYDEHKSGTADQVINKDGDAEDPTMLDSGGFLGAAECPSIPALTVAGVEVPFDLGPICGLLSSFGTLIVAFAYFLAARMIATN